MSRSGKQLRSMIYKNKLWFRGVTTWSSARIRQQFIDYFRNEHGHQFVPSSSTIPNKRQGTYFVNAGMNQFKSVFLGNTNPDSDLAHVRRAVNSQKCVRVGGKHNDLDDVGRDGYHHTFFEMLGNWSFGDYFQREICHMAWSLLTDVYKLPPDRLYVTYFGGNSTWNMAPDVECRDIWREIGVDEKRILPFGAGDNFWMMGETGPCGPCSEIHYDHVGNRNAAELVNANNPNVIELWNLVFMQYDKQKDNALRRLPRSHVDTGMGLERLTAVLQAKTSNYDTDLFEPIMNKIHKISGCRPYSGLYADDEAPGRLDTAYRIVSDHVRMMCVVIADGLLPGKDNLQHKLRQIMHRCFYQAFFVIQAPPGMVSELVDDVIASLGGFYPELRENYSKIKSVVSQTEERYLAQYQAASQAVSKVLQHSSTRNLTANQIDDLCNGKRGPPVPLHLLEDLSRDLNFTIDVDEYLDKVANDEKKDLDHVIEPSVAPRLDQFLVEQLRADGTAVTDDAAKYAYTRRTRDTYDFPSITATVQAILVDGQFVDSAAAGLRCGLLTSHSNFYAEAGGQVADKGRIVLPCGAEFVVDDVQEEQQYVLHIGHLMGVGARMSVGDRVHMRIDEDRRLCCMRNHTATHLVQSALRSVIGVDVRQVGSLVSQEQLTFDFAHVGTLSPAQIADVQRQLNVLVSTDVHVHVARMTLAEARQLRQLVPPVGDNYPAVVRVVTVSGATDDAADDADVPSRELCAGTHVIRTGDVLAVVITNVSGVSQGTKRLSAITGPKAEQAIATGGELRDHICHLEEDIDNKTRPDHWPQRIKALDTVFSTQILCKADKDQLYKQLDQLKFKATDCLNLILRERIKKTITDAMASSVDGETVFVNCDFTDHKQVIKVVDSMNLRQSLLVHNEPNKHWICVAYVPEYRGESASSWLRQAFDSVQSARHIDNRNNKAFHSVTVKHSCDRSDVIDKLQRYRKFS